jgi:error-prone DNA polymerase
LLGVAAPGVPVGRRGKHGTQLALPLDLHDAPELEELSVWDRLLADYGSIGVTLHEHPLELMRPTLPQGCFSSADLARARDGTPVRVAGLVVARQRPATAKGVTFMLLEDEFGTLNLIVPPPVHERCRLAVRGEPLIIASGKLEHREGVTNVLVHDVQRLDRGDLPKAEVRHIEPRRTWSSEAGEDVAATGLGDLREVAPAANSFGRGRR